MPPFTRVPIQNVNGNYVIALIVKPCLINKRPQPLTVFVRTFVFNHRLALPISAPIPNPTMIGSAILSTFSAFTMNKSALATHIKIFCSMRSLPVICENGFKPLPNVKQLLVFPAPMTVNQGHDNRPKNIGDNQQVKHHLFFTTFPIKSAIMYSLCGRCN